MIQMQTRLRVIDNTGIKIVQCIQTYRGISSKLGDLILISIKTTQTQLREKIKLKKGDLCKALIIWTKYKTQNWNNNFINFNENSVILLNNNETPLGSRILGPVPLFLWKQKKLKIITLTTKII